MKVLLVRASKRMAEVGVTIEPPTPSAVRISSLDVDPYAYEFVGWVAEIGSLDELFEHYPRWVIKRYEQQGDYEWPWSPKDLYGCVYTCEMYDVYP